MNFLDIVTKMQVNVSSDQVFEAFVNPDYIGGFWFSSSSERWEEGKKLPYDMKSIMLKSIF